MPHTYKFYYFNVRARGEHCRYVLYQSGGPFEDVRVPADKWSEMKPTVPFGQLPMLEVDGKHKIVQGNVISQFIAAEHGLAGRDHVEAARVFMLAHGVYDYQEKLFTVGLVKYLVPFMGMEDINKAKEMWHKEVKDGVFKDHCERYERFLKDNGGTWLVGNAVSWADLFQAEVMDRMLNLLDETALDAYPLLKDHHKRVHQLPNIKKYREARPKSNFNHDF